MSTTVDTRRHGVPFHRLVQVELRKMFDTRSGFWLMMLCGIVSVLVTIGMILWAGDGDITYGNFAAAIGVPLTILLPVMGILLITSEWSQRTGLVTFALVPHRSTLVLAKAVTAVIAGVSAIALAFSVGALGHVVAAAIRGVDQVWDMSPMTFVYICFANVLGMMVGFMLGTLIRNSAGAIVAYFVYSFALPTLSEVLRNVTDWFKDLQPWVDFTYAQSPLFEGDGKMTGEQWAHLGVTGLIWLVIPMIFGIWVILRSEVK